MGKMENRNFDDDLQRSNNPLLLKEWKRISQIFFPMCEFKHKEEDTCIQREFNVDAILKTTRGRQYSIELKTRRFDYLNWDTYPFEIVHHIYKDKLKTEKVNTKPGWLYTSTADLIFFATVNSNHSKILECLCFSLIPFKDDTFSSEIGKLKIITATTKFKSGLFQLTLNRIADINFIKNNALKFNYWKDDNEI